MTRTMLEIAGILVSSAVVLCWGLSHFARPIEHLVATATRLSEGEIDYPEESRSSAEAIALGAALTRLQSREMRLRRADAAAPMPARAAQAALSPDAEADPHEFDYAAGPAPTAQDYADWEAAQRRDKKAGGQAA